MKFPRSLLVLGAIFAAPSSASAETLADMSVGFDTRSGAGMKAENGAELPPYLQCVPFAREMSGIQIYGDAHSWWGQAAGRYQRGTRPQVGAVMAFQPHRNMTLGHVATVSKIIDHRTVLISHSNWSPINGRRGQIERNVRAIDASPDNDWSMVRVWYDPTQAIGVTAWPVHGFIYSGKSGEGQKLARAMPRAASSPAPAPFPPQPSKAFMRAFANLDAPMKTTPARAVETPLSARLAQSVRQGSVRAAPSRPDPVRDAIARYER